MSKEHIRFMKEIESIIKYAICSWDWKKINEHEQISIGLIAGSCKGKSNLLFLFDELKYRSKYYFVQEDLTTIDIYESVYSKVKNQKKSIMVMPELNRIFRHSKGAVSQLIGVILNMIEKKGMTHVKTKSGFEVTLNPKMRISLFFGLTPEIFWKNFKEWYQIGLISRLIVLSYSFSDKQQDEIIKYYWNYKKIEKNKRKLINLNRKKIDVSFPDEDVILPVIELAKKINTILFNKYIQFVGKRMNKKTKKYIKEQKENEKSGYIRLADKILTLCVGKAIYEKRSEVTKEDVTEIIRLIEKYGVFDFPISDQKKPKMLDKKKVKVSNKPETDYAKVWEKAKEEAKPKPEPEKKRVRLCAECKKELSVDNPRHYCNDECYHKHMKWLMHG